jgi:predicted N-acetyltransferase YhbS
MTAEVPPPASITVRRANPFDATAILQLGRLSFAELAERGVPIVMDAEACLLTLGDIIRHGFAFIAVSDGRAIGCVGGQPIKQWWSSAWSLQQCFWFVRPEYRASRAGAELMAAFVARAREARLPIFMSSLDGGGRERAMRRLLRSKGLRAVGSSFVGV